MKITFLGTGTSQGVPIIGSNHPVCLSNDFKDKRLRCSAMISWEDYNYVIDCGPDFRQQMLANNVNRLSGILFTHEHTDHVIGLDDIRPFFYKEKKDIPLYATTTVFKALSNRFHYIFENSNKYPGTPNVKLNEVNSNNKILLHNKKIQPIDVIHGNLPILGYRFDNLVYLTDVKSVPDESFKYLQNIDVLVVNALREENHFSHFTLTEALAFIEKVKPKKAYLTHISHLLGFHKEVQKKLPKNVFLAYDGLVVTVN